MNVNFEAIEKAWFKPKKTVLDELEEWLEEQVIDRRYANDFERWSAYKITFNLEESQILLDYITNLQQQIEEYQKALDETMSKKIDLEQNYNRLYTEDCKLRENRNINDVSLLDENYKLQQENEKLKERIEMAIDEVHEYRETLNTDFQHYVLKILNGSDENEYRT